MRSRTLGNTGLPCSELGLGTWGLSGDAYGPVNADEQRRVIARARALGISIYDTADVYGRGAMELCLADALGADPEVTVVTKIGTLRETEPPRKCFSRVFLERSLDACAARLRPRAPDVVLLHNPTHETLMRREATEFLAERAREGRIRAWGVSCGSARIAHAAIDAGAPILELAFNILWAYDYRDIEQRARSLNIGLLARSVLAHGLLAGLFSGDRVFAPYDHRAERWTHEELRARILQLDAIRPMVHGEVTSLRSAALRWVLSHEPVSSAILGPKNILQLDQLVRDSGRHPPYLSPESLAPLEARLEDLGARP